MRHVTIGCPNCGNVDHAVAAPDQTGRAGTWICFTCRSHGTYQISFTTAAGPATAKPAA
jgi:phage/plasmid primase-like uncharacterized protein